MFLTTLNKVGNMAVPISLFILGSKLYLSFGKIKTLLIRKKDVVSLCISKMLILPIFGLGILWVLIRMSKKLEMEIIPQLLLFMDSAMPSALTLITAFVIGGHGSNEASVLMLWEYVVCIFPITVAIFVWSVIYLK
jgi:hypothetical protein